MITIRYEDSGDEAEIFALTAAAFAPMNFSDGTEPQVIDDLRRDGDLAVSLVAICADEIVGHVAFSPVTIAGVHANWFGLGPVAVRPDLQKTGIGSLLINQGLSDLKSRGAAGCALVGNPDYYHRFGFQGDGRLQHGGLPDRLVQWVSFEEGAPSGQLEFCPAFGD